MKYAAPCSTDTSLMKLSPAGATRRSASFRPVRRSYAFSVPVAAPAANSRLPETSRPAVASPGVPATNGVTRPVSTLPRTIAPSATEPT